MNGHPCPCGANPPHPYNETVIFRREGMFYPIVGVKCEDWARHASLNPGTLSIEAIDGTRLWPETATQ